VSDCHFEYGASPSYGFSVPCSSLPGSGSSPVPVSASVAGLSVNTAYYFRIVATNPDGTSYGSEQTFKTPLAPTVLTGGASSLGQTSATLNATVNPNEEAVSDCHFEYGASPSYGSSVPCSSLPGSGSSPVPVSAPVAGLSANTIYYFRIVASNPGGTSYGNEQTFMTAAPELPELGRCLKLAGKAVGEFTTAACTIKSTGENTGRYEWEPWPLAKNHFSVKGGAATFETAGKATVKCLQNTYAGEYTGSQAATVTIIFAGCQASGALGGKCQSEAAQAGEIIASPLEGKLGVIKAVPTPSVGWDLKPVSQPDLATFKCGESAMSVAGSVIAPVTALDKMATTFKLKYKATKGKQAPENFEAGLKDTLSFLTESAEEQAGLTMADSIVNEEAVEIKAIV